MSSLPSSITCATALMPSIAGPNGERSAGYAGIGDITAVAKYLLLEETEFRPAVTGVGGVGFPTGHAHHLNPALLGQDAIGTGAFTFTTGINLYKWLKPFLFYSNIWLNSPVNLYTSNRSSVRSREFVTFNLAAEYPINKNVVLCGNVQQLDLDQYFYSSGLPIPQHPFGTPPGDRVHYHGKMGRFRRHRHRPDGQSRQSESHAYG